MLPCYFHGVFEGTDIFENGLEVESSLECMELCRRDADVPCAGFSYKPGKNGMASCFLKQDISNVDPESRQNWISGYPWPGCDGSCRVNDKIYTALSPSQVVGIVKLVDKASYVACKVLCLENDQCNFWEYSVNQATCTLYDQVKATYSNPEQQGHFVSGTAQCQNSCFHEGVFGSGSFMVLDFEEFDTLRCQDACQENIDCKFFTMDLIQGQGEDAEDLYLCELFSKGMLELQILNAPGMSVAGPKSCPNNKIFRYWMAEVSQYTGNLIESEEDQTTGNPYLIKNAAVDKYMISTQDLFKDDFSKRVLVEQGEIVVDDVISEEDEIDFTGLLDEIEQAEKEEDDLIIFEMTDQFGQGPSMAPGLAIGGEDVPLILGDDDYEYITEAAGDQGFDSSTDVESADVEDDLEQFEVVLTYEKRDAVPMDTDSDDTQKMIGEGNKDTEKVQIKFVYTDDKENAVEQTDVGGHSSSDDQLLSAISDWLAKKEDSSRVHKNVAEGMIVDDESAVAYKIIHKSKDGDNFADTSTDEVSVPVIDAADYVDNVTSQGDIVDDNVVVPVINADDFEQLDATRVGTVRKINIPVTDTHDAAVDTSDKDDDEVIVEKETVIASDKIDQKKEKGADVAFVSESNKKHIAKDFDPITVEELYAIDLKNKASQNIPKIVESGYSVIKPGGVPEEEKEGAFVIKASRQPHTDILNETQNIKLAGKSAANEGQRDEHWSLMEITALPSSGGDARSSGEITIDRMADGKVDVKTVAILGIVCTFVLAALLIIIMYFVVAQRKRTGVDGDKQAASN